ncbi:hypothetical protein BGZ63DRAFT_429536 [Mariannaea sp. PMI_226]|nr:hypothetical protein BGZ63DRAFT_429536 [Mariannaea sp. PMI_226]
MSSQLRKPEDVVDSRLRREELAKTARRLWNCLALAQFKAQHGCEDLSFHIIELAFEEEMQQAHFSQCNLHFY